MRSHKKTNNIKIKRCRIISSEELETLLIALAFKVTGIQLAAAINRFRLPNAPRHLLNMNVSYQEDFKKQKFSTTVL